MSIPYSKGFSTDRVMPRNASPSKTKTPRESDLNIMIVRGVGKVRSFKLSSRLLFFSVLFFSIYLLVSVFVINDYIRRRQEEQVRSKEFHRIQQELETARKALYRSGQRLALLQGQIVRREGNEPSPPISKQKAKPEESKPKAAEPKELERKESKPREPVLEQSGLAAPPPRETAARTEDKPSLLRVGIQDLSVKKNGAKVTVQFKVVNLSEGEGSVRGYVHTIAKADDADPPRIWTYPKVDLQDGRPVDYKQGKRFVIRHFTNIRGEFFLNPAAQPPSSLETLVYDQSGNLILKKDFDIKNAES
jgi:cytoskeletal protein RodZ